MINAVWLLSHCMAASTPQRHVPEVGRGIVLEALGEGRWCGWDRQGLEWHRGCLRLLLAQHQVGLPYILSWAASSSLPSACAQFCYLYHKHGHEVGNKAVFFFLFHT